MSRQSINHIKRRGTESSEGQQLPSQWGSVQRRLDYLQTTIAKLQKRTQKCQKRLDTNEEQLSSFRKQLKKKFEEVFIGQNHQIFQKERQLQLQNLRGQLNQLHSFIKRIEKKNNEIFKELKMNGIGGNHGLGTDEGLLERKNEKKLQEKLENIQIQNKIYIDRAVTQLKLLIKQQTKKDLQLQPKFTSYEISRSASKRNTDFQQKSSSKSIKASHLRVQPITQNNDTSFEEKAIGKSPKSPSNNGNSRVSYLRQKLKQFQQINKKYQDKTDKRSNINEEQKRTVQKMKDFKNYLQQSQSQLQQSNLEIKEKNAQTDSIKKWRSGQKYRYE